MRILYSVMALLCSCSGPESQKADVSSHSNSANVETKQRQDISRTGTATQVDGSGSALPESLPYLAVRNTSGPALQALMSGRLEIQGNCVVFVEPGVKPKLAVFHPPASLRRGTDGEIAVASLNFVIEIGREVRVGGGILPPGEDVSAALRAPVADSCPDKAVEIGELVR